jgi:hypothetical protein
LSLVAASGVGTITTLIFALALLIISRVQRILEVQKKPKRDIKFKAAKDRPKPPKTFNMERVNQNELAKPLNDGLYTNPEHYQEHWLEPEEDGHADDEL